MIISPDKIELIKARALMLECMEIGLRSLSWMTETELKKQVLEDVKSIGASAQKLKTLSP